MPRKVAFAGAVLLGFGVIVALVRAQDGTHSVLRSITDSAAEPALASPPASRSAMAANDAPPPDEPMGSGLADTRQAQLPNLADRLKRLRESVRRDGAASPSPAREPRATSSADVTAAPITGPISSNPALPDSSRRTRVRTAPLSDSDPAHPGGTTTTPSPRMSVTDEAPDTNRYSEGIVVDAPRFRPEGAPEPNGLSSPQAVASPAELPTRPLPSQSHGVGALTTSGGPMLRVDTLGPPAILLGRPAEYTITLTNASDVAAHGVYVRLSLPASVQVQEAVTTAGNTQTQADGPNQQKIVWTVDQSAPHSEETLTLSMTPLANQSFDLSVDWTVRPISSTAKIEVQQPRLEMALFGPKSIEFGETAVYTIQITNPGTGAAENVSLEFAYGAKRLENKAVGTLLPGEQTEINVELTAQQAGELRVAAAATADGDLRVDATENVIVRRAALAVEVAGSALQFAGSVGTYRVRVKNIGDANARGVVASIALPSGATLMGTGQTATSGRIVQEIGDLTPGGERTITLQCQLLTPGENRVEAMASAGGGLESAANFVTKVEALADLKLTVSDPRGPMPVGEDAIYEIRITNRGTKAAEQVNVVGQFSDGVEPVEASGAAAELVTGQVLFQRLTRVEPGEEVVLKIVARAERAGNHRFRAELTCQAPDTQLIAEETTYFFGDEAARVSTRPGNTTN